MRGRMQRTERGGGRAEPLRGRAFLRACCWAEAPRARVYTRGHETAFTHVVPDGPGQKDGRPCNYRSSGRPSPPPPPPPTPPRPDREPKRICFFAAGNDWGGGGAVQVLFDDRITK